MEDAYSSLRFCCLVIIFRQNLKAAAGIKEIMGSRFGIGMLVGGPELSHLGLRLRSSLAASMKKLEGKVFCEAIQLYGITLMLSGSLRDFSPSGPRSARLFLSKGYIECDVVVPKEVTGGTADGVEEFVAEAMLGVADHFVDRLRRRGLEVRSDWLKDEVAVAMLNFVRVDLSQVSSVPSVCERALRRMLEARSVAELLGSDVPEFRLPEGHAIVPDPNSPSGVIFQAR